jgi:hypothetical protein
VLLQGFSTQDLPACGVLVSAGIGDIPAGLGGATHTRIWHRLRSVHPRRCSRASSL